MPVSNEEAKRRLREGVEPYLKAFCADPTQAELEVDLVNDRVWGTLWTVDAATLLADTAYARSFGDAFNFLAEQLLPSHVQALGISIEDATALVPVDGPP